MGKLVSGGVPQGSVTLLPTVESTLGSVRFPVGSPHGEWTLLSRESPLVPPVEIPHRGSLWGVQCAKPDRVFSKLVEATTAQIHAMLLKTSLEHHGTM